MTVRTLAMTAVAAGIGLVGVASAGQKMQLNDLPPAVQKGVQDHLKGGTVKTVTKEVEKGKTQYEIESVLNGRTRDFNLDTAGNLLVMEEELAMEDVPAPVKAALEKQGKIVRVELMTEGKKVVYEAQVEKNGKKASVSVDSSGKKVQ